MKKARSMTGIQYKQEREEQNHLRQGYKKALTFMDCAEFVCRVLHADGITKKVKHRNS